MAETLGELETQLRKRVEDELQSEISEFMSGFKNVIGAEAITKPLPLFDSNGESMTFRQVLHEIERFIVQARMPKDMKNAISKLLEVDNGG